MLGPLHGPVTKWRTASQTALQLRMGVKCEPCARLTPSLEVVSGGGGTGHGLGR